MLIQKSISGYFYKKIKNMIKVIGPVFTQNFLSLSGVFFFDAGRIKNAFTKEC